VTGFPIDNASRVASSSLAAMTFSANFLRGLPRSDGDSALHAGKAASAAVTALFTSSMDASATWLEYQHVYLHTERSVIDLPLATSLPE
jgi:hypothetical protein